MFKHVKLENWNNLISLVSYDAWINFELLIIQNKLVSTYVKSLVEK